MTTFIHLGTWTVRWFINTVEDNSIKSVYLHTLYCYTNLPYGNEKPIEYKFKIDLFPECHENKAKLHNIYFLFSISTTEQYSGITVTRISVPSNGPCVKRMGMQQRKACCKSWLNSAHNPGRGYVASNLVVCTRWLNRGSKVITRKTWPQTMVVHRVEKLATFLAH